MHANPFWTFEKTTLWFYSTVFQSVFYFAVPVFFMITGALLIDFDKKYDIKTYFSKRIQKTVIPYIFWAFIMSIALAYAHHDTNQFIECVFSGIGIYWFFIPLFGIYLCIPLFSSIKDEKKLDIFKYIIVVGFIINILIPFIISVFNLKIEFALNIAVVGNYLMYPLVGYVLHNIDLGKKRFIIYIFALLALLANLFGTYYLSIAAGTIIDTFMGYEKLPCFLYSIGIFIFIKDDLSKIMNYENINKAVNYLSHYTFGVYLIHVFILEFAVMILHINGNTLIYKLVAPIICFIISIVILYIMRKIPYMERIVP